LLRHKYWNATKWSDWEDLDARVNAAPAAVSWGQGRIDIFAQALESFYVGRTFHIAWGDDGWSSWGNMHLLHENAPRFGVNAPAPAVCARGVNVLDLFIVGDDKMGTGDPNSSHCLFGICSGTEKNGARQKTWVEN